jgi:hypothetical protein
MEQSEGWNEKKSIDLLESSIKNPAQGLPEEIFLFVSRITPLINVDLLIKNVSNKTLLTWRDDGFCPPGWHIPGGIIRFKETIVHRLNAVAAGELGAKISFKEEPLAINEVVHASRRVRGHFISLLYECTLVSALDQSLKYGQAIPKPGQWAWHGKCPDDLLQEQQMYRKYIE